MTEAARDRARDAPHADVEQQRGVDGAGINRGLKLQGAVGKLDIHYI